MRRQQQGIAQAFGVTIIPEHGGEAAVLVSLATLGTRTYLGTHTYLGARGLLRQMHSRPVRP